MVRTGIGAAAQILRLRRRTSKKRQVNGRRHKGWESLEDVGIVKTEIGAADPEASPKDLERANMEMVRSLRVFILKSGVLLMQLSCM